MDRPGHENDRAFYCEAWNGTSGYTYDRIGRGTVRVTHDSVSLESYGKGSALYYWDKGTYRAIPTSD